jgi:hypothetical protein
VNFDLHCCLRPCIFAGGKEGWVYAGTPQSAYSKPYEKTLVHYMQRLTWQQQHAPTVDDDCVFWWHLHINPCDLSLMHDQTMAIRAASAVSDIQQPA